MHQTASQIESIESALAGRFYSRFAVSDGFDFYFDDFVLSSREIVTSGEPAISAALANAFPAVSSTANPESIAKSAVAAACLGAPVVTARILPDSALLIIFSNNVTICLPTDTPIVDWHWAITEGGGDPYLGCLAACFSPGDVQGSVPNNSFKPKPLRGSA